MTIDVPHRVRRLGRRAKPWKGAAIALTSLLALLAVAGTIEHIAGSPLDHVRPDTLSCVSKYSGVELTVAHTMRSGDWWDVDFTGTGPQVLGGHNVGVPPAFGRGEGDVAVDVGNHRCSSLIFDVNPLELPRRSPLGKLTSPSRRPSLTQVSPPQGRARSCVLGRP